MKLDDILMLIEVDYDETWGFLRRNHMSPSIRTVGECIGALIALCAIGYLWFNPTGAILLLKNIPPWVFRYLPSLQVWLIRRTMISGFLVSFRAVLLSALGIGIIIVSARLEIRF